MNSKVIWNSGNPPKYFPLRRNKKDREEGQRRGENRNILRPRLGDLLDNCIFLQVNIWNILQLNFEERCKEINDDRSYVQNSSENKARV